MKAPKVTEADRYKAAIIKTLQVDDIARVLADFREELLQCAAARCDRLYELKKQPGLPLDGGPK